MIEIGDKIKRIHENHSKIKVGEVVTVRAINKECTQIRLEEYTGVFSSQYFELVEKGKSICPVNDKFLLWL